MNIDESASVTQPESLAKGIFDAIFEALLSNQKTCEPLNALVVWTELGKGLAGMLERKGGDPGLLSRIVLDFCRDRGATPLADLSRYAYHLPRESRMSREEVAAALTRVERRIESFVGEEAQDLPEDERARRHFIAVARAWFSAGREIILCLPGCRDGGDLLALGIMSAWCDRYLPKDNSGPSALGVRVERRA